MNIDLSGKRAIVCGSSKGIGKAVAHELANLGATVILIARDGETLKQVKGELSRDAGQRHDFIAVDFAEVDTLEQKITQFVSTNPPVHILVNNTGGPPAGPIFEAETQEFLQGFSNHLICNHILTQTVVPGMKTEGYGRIINIISTSVKQPIKGLGVSNTVRGAVASWAKTLAGELAAFGITVNNILPGATKTTRLQSLIGHNAKKSGVSVEALTKQMLDQIPTGRFAETSEIANAAVFLATPAAAYINGVSLAVDGGRTQCL
ncbi:SDR family oxidoreductase [candidate division KSB1 bacterium]|nr:SDR family oxidoreductase [candidate division KSB1 bacterium]NIR70201.1 SDR family oxidoreductase [candidate division KSB1 bacterium]NIS27588.1 SDR family oxidoreductase [candidate division KSB1 bacterium]NIT74440.1 SDR family oxidoreductase [candidate division KSB1 bacterium]NIU28305.1 SDR family oxidoreductase [candidate division KSB1 bacterium]